MILNAANASALLIRLTLCLWWRLFTEDGHKECPLAEHSGHSAGSSSGTSAAPRIPLPLALAQNFRHKEVPTGISLESRVINPAKLSRAFPPSRGQSVDFAAPIQQSSVLVKQTSGSLPLSFQLESPTI